VSAPTVEVSAPWREVSALGSPALSTLKMVRPPELILIIL